MNRKTLVSVVVIGRNEGERLLRCLKSINMMQKENFEIEIIYVDSASTDDSVQNASAQGARVIEVKPDRPSAACGRNAGWRAASGEHVLFLDGDTILHPLFVSRALQELQNSNIAVVWGHRREIDPEQSLYVRVLDLDWIYPAGFSEFCGGDALMRRDILERVDGFDDSLIAGEEPELCRRIRACGYRILHIDAPMTQHDLAIRNFSAYWKRAFRAGHAYATLASRFSHTDDPLWQKEARRNLYHGSVLMLSPIIILAALFVPWLSSFLLAGGMAMVIRSATRCHWKTSRFNTRILYAVNLDNTWMSA